MKIILISLILFISNINADINSFLKEKIYSVSYNEIPHYKEIVNQHLVKKLPEYQKGWNFCSQASWATAFNILRSKRNANKVNQLSYFHKKLNQYSAYRKDYKKEASGDWLQKITNRRNDFRAEKKTTTSRRYIKSYLHKALVSNKHQIPIILSQININSTKFSHFYVVYKVDYKKNGRVYYADPYTGRTGSMNYGIFLDGMKNAGTKGRYSFWIIEKR